MGHGLRSHRSHGLRPRYAPHSQPPLTFLSCHGGQWLHPPHLSHWSCFRTHLILKNVLVVPHLVKNLISIRRFTIDNLCSIEFDPFGFSVKDLRTKAVIIRCNSHGELYVLPSPATTAYGLLAASTSTELWHHRLGHPGRDATSHLSKKSFIPCNKIGRAHV